MTFSIFLNIIFFVIQYCHIDSNIPATIAIQHLISKIIEDKEIFCWLRPLNIRLSDSAHRCSWKIKLNQWINPIYNLVEYKLKVYTYFHLFCRFWELAIYQSVSGIETIDKVPYVCSVLFQYYCYDK